MDDGALRAVGRGDVRLADGGLLPDAVHPLRHRSLAADDLCRRSRSAASAGRCRARPHPPLRARRGLCALLRRLVRAGDHKAVSVGKAVL